MNAKADCEELLNALVPFAEKMLVKHGEFYPFGGAMRPNREIVYVAGYDGRERPPSLEIIRLIKADFSREASNGSYIATALLCDTLIREPNGDRKIDSISISLNHRDDYSVVVLLPYRLNKRKLSFDAAIANAGEADIFPAERG